MPEPKMVSITRADLDTLPGTMPPATWANILLRAFMAGEAEVKISAESFARSVMKVRAEMLRKPGVQKKSFQIRQAEALKRVLAARKP